MSSMMLVKIVLHLFPPVNTCRTLWCG